MFVRSLYLAGKRIIMETLLKDLSMRLPYGVKFYDLVNERVFSLNWGAVQDYVQNNHLWVDCKPIYHPLSDLTKEIEHKGERFEFTNKLYSLYDYEDYVEGLIIDFEERSYINWKSLPYELLEVFLEYHFDVFGLIEKGLAISVHDLETNPYE